MNLPNDIPERTRELLCKRPANLQINKIAKEVRVSTAWLNKFARGKIKNPGVVTICALHNYLLNYGKEAANA